MHAEILYVHQIKKFNVFFPSVGFESCLWKRILNPRYVILRQIHDTFNWICNKWTPLNIAKAGGWNPSCLTPKRWWLKFETSWKGTCFCKLCSNCCCFPAFEELSLSEYLSGSQPADNEELLFWGPATLLRKWLKNFGGTQRMAKTQPDLEKKPFLSYFIFHMFNPRFKEKHI